MPREGWSRVLCGLGGVLATGRGHGSVAAGMETAPRSAGCCRIHLEKSRGSRSLVSTRPIRDKCQRCEWEWLEFLNSP